MMELVPLNNELSIQRLEGFRVLDEEERGRLNFMKEGPGICLSDPERHILVSVAYKKIGGFSNLLLNEKDLVKNMEAGIAKAMRPFDFQKAGAVQRTVGGRAAEGFSYTYMAQSVAMYAEALLVRSGKTIFYLYLYAREELKQESIPVWEELLAGAEWS